MPKFSRPKFMHIFYAHILNGTRARHTLYISGLTRLTITIPYWEQWWQSIGSATAPAWPPPLFACSQCSWSSAFSWCRKRKRPLKSVCVAKSWPAPWSICAKANTTAFSINIKSVPKVSENANITYIHIVFSIVYNWFDICYIYIVLDNTVQPDDAVMDKWTALHPRFRRSGYYWYVETSIVSECCTKACSVYTMLKYCKA